jgi:tungstate transport system substrate-binding protein
MSLKFRSTGLLLGLALFLASCGEQPVPVQPAETSVDSAAVVTEVTGYPPRESVERLLVATTTSLYDTGLWAYMEPMFEETYGVELDILYAGTGKALEWGTRGDVDVVVVHDRAREDQFIADGFGLSRTPFAYNYFVIVGPPDDPAGIRDMAPEAALTVLYEDSTWPFISRGDESGTHAQEQRLWALAGLDYDSVRVSGEWYVEAAAGMGPTLNMADEMRGYTLSDIATFLAYQGDVDLEILIGSGDSMRNVYAVIPLSAARDSVMADNMRVFLTSPEVQELIGGYGVEAWGRQLFTPCAGQDL